MIVVETQRLVAERMKARIRSHAVGHAPFVAAPGLVADLLLEAVAAP